MSQPTSHLRRRQKPLRPGEVVEVRSAAELLGSLDSTGSLDNMPLMPEMLRFAGQRFTVSRRVDKICDTIAATGSRRMRDTVYLEDLRCDGSGHGGCQAGCLIYWKEAWLRRVDEDADVVRLSPEAEAEAAAEVETLTVAGTRPRVDPTEEGDFWRCQATEAFRASEVLKTSNLSQYWREMRNGNFKFPRFVFLLARAFVLEVMDRVGKLRPLPLKGPGSSPPAELDLQPGERVRVRSKQQIAATLDENGLNRRLSFDREMLPYCGRIMRVQDRVERIIEDKTGRMIKIPKDCIILEGGVCEGTRSAGRWFCPRQIYAFWREGWVERVDEPRQA